jgi:hypothetical protein
VFRAREKYNAYMRTYLKRRYRARMAAAHQQLGGKCVWCGSTKNLEIDHKDPTTKNYAVGSVIMRLSVAKLTAELALCQLLCATCHAKKSCTDQGKIYSKEAHGTLSAYRYCPTPKCEACKAAKRRWMREYRSRKIAGP